MLQTHTGPRPEVNDPPLLAGCRVCAGPAGPEGPRSCLATAWPPLLGRLGAQPQSRSSSSAGGRLAWTAGISQPRRLGSPQVQGHRETNAAPRWVTCRLNLGALYAVLLSVVLGAWGPWERIKITSQEVGEAAGHAVQDEGSGVRPLWLHLQQLRAGPGTGSALASGLPAAPGATA